MSLIPKILLMKIVSQPEIISLCDTDEEANIVKKWDQKQCSSDNVTYYKIPITLDVEGDIGCPSLESM